MSTLLAIGLSRDYAWVILSSATIAMQVVFTGFGVGKLRKSLNVPYPDMGNGRFAAKLNDEDWEKFNNYQRAHYNYVEQVSSIQTLLLLGGLFYPKIAAALGLKYVFGRFLFTRGYRKHGAKGRLTGSPFIAISLLGLFGVTVFGSTKALL